MLIIFVLEVTLFACQKEKQNSSEVNCLFFCLELYFWAFYFRMEKIKCKKTSKSHRKVLRKLEILKGYVLSQEKGINPKVLPGFLK